MPRFTSSIWDSKANAGPAPDQPPGDAPPGYQWAKTWDPGWGKYVYDLVAIPNYGDQPAQGRAPVYGSAGGASVVGVEPVGYGYVRINYSDGSSEVVADRSATAQQAQQQMYGDLPTGYVPIRDPSGNTIGYEQDRNYESPSGLRNYNEGVRQFDTGQSNYQQDYGEGVRRYDIGQGNNVRDYGEDVRRYDQGYAEDLRRYDADLSERIAGRQQRIQEISMQEAGATGRTAMTLANEKAMLTERLANDMAIAKMDNATRLQIAQMEGKVQMRGQDVTQRGQDVEGRGQDISREGNIMNARQRQLEYSTRVDPIRQAITLVGGSGGNTPFELAAEDMRRSIPAMPNIAAMPVRVAAGGATVSDREPVLMGEGRNNEGVRMGTSELMMPMPNGDKRVMPQVGPGVMVYRDPVTGREYGMSGGQRMAEGGDVAGAPTLPSGLAALGYKSWADVVKAFGSSMLRDKARLIELKRQLPVELQGLGTMGIYSRLKQWAAGTGAPPVAPPAAPPPEPPAPGPTITPEDAALLPGGAYADDAAVAAAREVVRKALSGIVSGTDQPATDLKLPSVYGVNIGNPQDFAYSFPKMDRPSQELLTGAFDLRGVEGDVFERRRRQYVPVTSSFRTGWG